MKTVTRVDLTKGIVSTILAADKDITKEQVLKVICDRTDVSLEEIKSLSRKRQLVNARILYCLIALQFFNGKGSIIRFINRNHTMMAYYKTKGDAYLNNEQLFRNLYYSCIQKIYS